MGSLRYARVHFREVDNPIIASWLSWPPLSVKHWWQKLPKLHWESSQIEAQDKVDMEKVQDQDGTVKTMQRSTLARLKATTNLP
jgi:hypothetical protein